MAFGLALNLHDDVPATVRWLAQNIILGATLLVVILLGGPLFRAAWQELRKGRLTIEALFLLTMSGALAASLQAHITGKGKIYFEVVSILLVVYTLGKTIGAHIRAAALAGSRAWAGQFETCRLVDANGRARIVPVTEIQIGDRVEVNPGETFAVDGVIREGVGFVSEAAVSGEPFAIVRRPGDRVLAGAASHDATFRIEATARGTERQLDSLLTAVEQARDRPVSLQAQADRLGRWFFPLVVITAIGTFGYWTFLTDEGWESGLFNAMSVLLVACPCVIGLATPIVIWSALGRLAERGVIVCAGEAIERLAEVDCVMLDKTGTLTDDCFTLLDIATAASGEERAKLLGWLALVQERSGHPIARAFAKLPRPFAADAEPRVLSVRAVPGCGVEAKLEEASGTRHIIQIGTPEWIGSLSGESHRSAIESQLHATGHRIEVAVDGEVVAIAVLAEQLRDSTTQALRAFTRLGLPVEVLTGDTAERAAALNLPKTRAVLLPNEKLAVIEAAKAEGGKPLFVGDGINDAAALASAHVGIALASGTDIAVTAAPVTLYHNDLRLLPWAIQLSREAVRAVRRNMYRACAYNLIGMSLAACGLLHPVAAAVLMVVSSLSLVFSSARVSVITDCCDEPVPVQERKPGPTRRLARWSVLHALGFALQGVVFLLLLEPARSFPAAAIILACFALAGCALAYLWRRWSAVPHCVDMCFGMLTFGNLGMLLGWWMDNGFSALHDHGCCACVAAMRDGAMQVWMWVGMMLFANVAMLWLSRRPLQRGTHCAAMFSGGNLGMVVGMLAGGWCASQFETASMSLAVAASFAGMTAGMLAGMLVGTWVTERAFTALQPARWLRHRGVAQPEYTSR
jgi:heavy metal translocating P-type ATPase